MSITPIIKKVRALAVDDYNKDSMTYEFLSDLTFTLPNASVQGSSIKVYINGALVENVTGDTKYTFDEDTSKLTFEYQSGLLASGDIIEVYFKCYKNWTDDEVVQYIHAAIIRMSVEKYTTFVLRDDATIFPTPVETDENLIALIASILMEGNLASYRTNEINIAYAKDEDNDSRSKRTLRQWKKTYGVLDYANLRRPYTLFVEDSDMTLENLP